MKKKDKEISLQEKTKQLQEEELTLFRSYNRHASSKVKKEILIGLIHNITKQEFVGEIT